MRINFVKKLVGLAPMAGFTDSSFRQICRENGADFVYTELISARGLVEDAKAEIAKSWRLASFTENERPILVQIFGSEPEIMADAARLIEERLKPEGIDINMGCPAPKVVKNAYGSALMRNPQAASEIIKAVKKAVNVPVWVKTRLGWSENDEILEFGKILEDAGVDAVAVHARTKLHGFQGEPDWETLGKLKQKLTIPIIANGGIKSWQDAQQCFTATGADGILIGQAAIGRPWIFKEITDGKDIRKSLEEMSECAVRHLELFRGRSDSFNEIKNHLTGYFKGFDNCSELRRKIVLCNDFDECRELLAGLKMSQLAE